MFLIIFGVMYLILGAIGVFFDLHAGITMFVFAAAIFALQAALNTLKR